MTSISTRRSLHRLIYCSSFSARFPVAADDQDEEINKIIRVSIAENRQRALSGLLLVHQNAFIQALEGPAEAVMTTYNHILSDPRHQDAHIVGAGPVENRRFSNWNMCARRLSPTDDAILQTLDLKGAIDPRGLSASKALNLLTAVKTIQWRAVAGAEH
jgi:hypothetical protein